MESSLRFHPIFLTAGAMLPCRIDGQTKVTSDLKEAIGKAGRQDIDMATFLNWQERYCASPGTCSMMGTANTMGCFLEAAGLAPFGSATMLTFDAAKQRQARDVGERIVSLTRQETRVDVFLNKSGLENGIKLISASGGSTNAVLHLIACARLMNLKLDLRQFETIQSSVPVLAKFKPSSSFHITDFHQAGGVPGLLKNIAGCLDLEAPLCMGGRLGEALDATPLPDQNIIHPLADPISPQGCFSILYGNLAPAGALVKKTGVAPGGI